MAKPGITLVSLKAPTELELSPNRPATKPETCRNCRLYTTTTGIVLDDIRPEHKLALVFLSPSSDDINERRPLAGGMGWFIQRTVMASGLRLEDVGCTYIFRCYADRAHRDNNGKLKESTIRDGFEGCRVHDHASDSGGQRLGRGIREWSPDVYIPTFEPAKGQSEPAFALLVRRDLEKARGLMEHGHRPAVIFGSAAMKLIIAGSEDGGMRMWRGDKTFFTWEPKVDRKENVQLMFADPPVRPWRRRR